MSSTSVFSCQYEFDSMCRDSCFDDSFTIRLNWCATYLSQARHIMFSSMTDAACPSYIGCKLRLLPRDICVNYIWNPCFQMSDVNLTCLSKPYICISSKIHRHAKPNRCFNWMMDMGAALWCVFTWIEKSFRTVMVRKMEIETRKRIYKYHENTIVRQFVYCRSMFSW